MYTRLIIGLLLAYFLFSNFQCDDDDGLRISIHSKIEFSAIQKNYPLEDTLWLSTKITPSQFESERFPFSLSIKGEPAEFINTNINENTLTINHLENGSDIQFEFGCPALNDEYQFEFGIIFQKKGLYSLQMIEYHTGYLEGDISCDSLDFNFTSFNAIDYTFNVPDSNLDLYYNTSATNRGLLPNNGEKMLQEKKAFILRVE